MKKILLIIAAVLVLLPLKGAAQDGSAPILFHMLDEGSGLPENNVRSLLMLPDGRMLIRTASYLSVFDGAYCRNFEWDKEKVPYMEYSGESGMYYDEPSALVVLQAPGYRWAFDTASETFFYEGVPEVSEMSASIPQGQQDMLASRTLSAKGLDGSMWFLSDKRVVSYTPEGSRMREIVSIPSGSDDLFTSLAIGPSGRVWIGSARSGLRYIEKDGRIVSLPYLETVDGRKVYPHTDISYLYADPRGGLWVATQSEGLLYTHRDILRFRTVNNSTLSAGKMQDEGVKCLAEAPDGQVLVGTVHGLVRYNPASNTVDTPWPRLKDALVISLYVDSRRRIWVGTFYDGLFLIGTDGKIRNYNWPEDGNVDVAYKEGRANRNCVRTMLEAPDGSFWISVYGGVGRFDPSTGEIRLLRDSHPELENQRIVRTLSFLEDGSLSAAGDNGSFRYSVTGDSVISVSSDNPFLTSGGRVMSRVIDESGDQWFTTFSRLGHIRNGGDEQEITTYGAEYGVSCGAFLENSVLRHSDGKLYFGGAAGFVIADPAAANLRDYGIAPVISSVTVSDIRHDVSGGKLQLKYNDSDIRIVFSNLNYANPTLSVYRYRLEGQDKKWHIVSSVKHAQAVYSSLPSGRYTLTAQASNNGADWSPYTNLEIDVKPPFWKTKLAYLLYAFLVVAALAGVFELLYTRQKHKLQRRAEDERHRQEKELSEMKLRFFTNISHELRTPLSLILLPLESIMKEKDKGTEEYSRLDTMHRNAKSLLDLVNHLLDFRKLEMGGEKIHLAKGNYSEFAASLVESFKSAAAEKNMTLEFTDETSNPLVDFDKSMMQKVLNNLISNAFKYTPSGGAIEVRLTSGDESIRTEVKDTGIGIPQKDLAEIFDRFFRSSNASAETGSGIGLSLVKQYVEMHGGTVGVTSQEGEGSCFWFEIPCADDSEAAQEASDAEPVSEQKRILVVDDNQDFRDYLQSELSSLYSVSVASSGEEALKKIEQVRPDIVVSDVMMPGIGGLELTRRIKENVETSHIPVILLTARTSEDIRTESYEYGADAYLTKPFLMEMLQARIKNLLEEREKRIRTFSTGADVSPMHVTITTVDQKLMSRIMSFLEKNMDNTEYSVEQLASDVGMHRMNLYRKIQSLYGMTPSEFIRTMRLKRAAQILADDPNINVSEVADMVGFNTPKYFTKYFKEFFGVLPSQYNKK